MMADEQPLDSVYGIPVRTSPLVKPGTALLINPSALAMPRLDVGFIDLEPLDDPDAKLAFMAELRATFLSIGPVEPDPFWRKPPRGARARLDWVLSVIGYDWRRARGRLRRLPVTRPNAFAKLTVLS